MYIILYIYIYNFWEVGESVCSGNGDALAAAHDLLSIVPQKLRTVWAKIVSGTAVTIRAPESFWTQPISEPFRALRAECT